MPTTKRILMAGIVLCALSCTSLWGNYYYNSIFMRAYTSARQTSMGLNSSGGAYIWSQNPLTLPTNPALISYQNGFNYALSRHIFPTETVTYTSSYMGFGGNGWGVMLPSANLSSGFGGELEEEIGQLSISTQYYGFGINLTKLTDLRMSSEAKEPRAFNVSVGFSLARFAEDQWSFGERSGETLDGGFLAEFTPTALSDAPVDFSVVAGANFYNLFQGEIVRYRNKQEPMIYGMIWSAASRFAIRTDNVDSEIFRKICPNFLSVTAVVDYDDICYDKDAGDRGSRGVEIGLMNTFFLRQGENYHAVESKTSEDKIRTLGMGINLQYDDLVQCEWNYAEYGPGDDRVHVWDMMLHVNFWKLMAIGTK